MNLLLPIFIVLLAFYAAASVTPAPPQMIVFNGGIQSHEGCAYNETIANFTMCVVQCAKVESCLFCFMNNGCFLCEEGVLSTDTDEWRIGVKNVKKSYEKSCPAEAMHMKYQDPALTTKKANLAPSPPQMIVLNGVITTSSEWCVQNETIRNFTMCVVQCAKIESCQFCFMEKGCWMCQEGVVSTDSDQWRIGMKNVNKTNSCPSGSWHLEYNNSLGDQADSVLTEETSSTRTVPITTTTPKKSCPNPSSWSIYRNTWCIVPPFNKYAGFSHSDGLSQCQGQKSSQKMYMSGLEYREMLIDLRIFARKQLKNLNNASFAMWIDGYQSKPCTENCFPGSFTFTDPHLENYTSYEWYSKGNVVEYGGVGTCLQLMFPSNTSDPRFGKVSYAECNVAQDEDFMRRAVVCGTPAV